MYQYIVHYDIEGDDGVWIYNKTYSCFFDSKTAHKKASKELESYLESFNNFRINKVTCD